MGNMNRELAVKIVELTKLEKQIHYDKYEIRHLLKHVCWEDVCTEAMAFLLEQSHGN